MTDEQIVTREWVLEEHKLLTAGLNPAEAEVCRLVGEWAEEWVKHQRKLTEGLEGD